jgi:small nuclear ribonucleoprotein (snRNP)-like protein
MSSITAKRYFEEMVGLLQKSVTVVTTSDKRYTGTLTGLDPQSMSLSLSDARGEDGKSVPKMFISGNIIGQILAAEKPFDLKGLAERLERVFPNLVRLYEDIGIIVVMEKIRVNQGGIIEGSGPAAERVKKIYDAFIKGK